MRNVKAETITPIHQWQESKSASKAYALKILKVVTDLQAIPMPVFS
jgi:hypothetical protein